MYILPNGEIFREPLHTPTPPQELADERRLSDDPPSYEEEPYQRDPEAMIVGGAADLLLWLGDLLFGKAKR